MADGRRRHDWNIAGNVMVLLAEPHRDKKKRRTPYTVADFNPYAPKPKPTPVPIDALRYLFVPASLEPAAGAPKRKRK